MSTVSDLRITVDNVNRLLAEVVGDWPRVRVSMSYSTRRLFIDYEDGMRDTPPRGPKECLVYAEGMERALELIAYGSR